MAKSIVLTLVTSIASVCSQFLVVGKFGGEKVWQIWQIIFDSPN